MFQVKVQKNIARLTVQEKMTSGSQDVYVVGFEFSEEWAYLERTAVFKSGDVIINVLLDDTNQCMIPWEVLTNYDASVSMGVFGTKDGHVVLPTIWAKTDPILEGVITGITPSEPTPDIYQQLLARLASIEEKIDEGGVGITFTPSISEDGELTWTNNGDLPNPDPVNVIGPKGDKGDDGSPGPQGPAGQDGQPGEKGDVGPQGPAGADGGPGPQGEPGVIFTPTVSEAGELRWTNDGGLTNPDPVNIRGPKGEPGEKGDPGQKGDKGDIGDTGPQGPAGQQGEKGDPGVTFTPSVSESGEISWTNDGGLPNPTPTNIKGSKGDKGDPGPQGPAGPAGSGANLTAGEGIAIEGDSISVSLPTKALTTAEYEALSEEEKQADIQYIITDDNDANSGAPVLQTLDITVPPDKVSYATGDTFDPTGMLLTATYEDAFFKNPKDYTIMPDGPLDEGMDEVTISYTENDVTVTAEQPISVTSTHIYGVTWDGTSTTKWTRTDEAAMFTDPVPYVAGATSYSSPFDNLMPWAGMVKEERTGGTMVAIPKFWYQLKQNTEGTPRSGMTIRIANAPVEGFSVSPAHIDRGDGKGERDVVYVGRYHCAASDYKSKTGVLPMANITRATARTEIHKIGSNIWHMDFATWFTIWLLYLVEFADWNTQKTIGKGCGNNSNTGKMGYTDSMPYHTGTTQSKRDTYGLGTQYRNIEGLWDNVNDWCDGCYNNSAGMNVIINPNDFSDGSGGISVGTPCNASYPLEFTVSSAAGFVMFFGSKGGGSETTFLCDKWGFSASSSCVCVGGRYTQDGSYGLFCVLYSVSGNYPHIGSRIQELP